MHDQRISWFFDHLCFRRVWNIFSTSWNRRTFRSILGFGCRPDNRGDICNFFLAVFTHNQPSEPTLRQASSKPVRVFFYIGNNFTRRSKSSGRAYRSAFFTTNGQIRKPRETQRLAHDKPLLKPDQTGIGAEPYPEKPVEAKQTCIGQMKGRRHSHARQ